MMENCFGDVDNSQLNLELASPFEPGFFADASTICASLYSRCSSFLVAKNTIAGRSIVGEVQHAQGDLGGLECWRPELGLAYRAIHEGGRGPMFLQWLELQTTIAGYLSGRIECFDILCQIESPFTVAGITFTMPRVHARSDGGTLLIDDVTTGERHRFSHVSNGREASGVWQREGAPAGAIVTLKEMQVCQVVDENWLREWRFIQSEDEPNPPNDEFPQQITQALGLLQDTTPEYFLWVVAVLRHVLRKQRSGPEHSTSRSFLFHFGGVEVGTPASPVESLELLVHEASHQYFHMASLLGQTTTPQAGHYLSPLKGRVRPLERILIGFHAVGNIFLSLNAVSGITASEQREVDTRLATAHRLLGELSPPLEAEVNTGLTAIGRGIYTPLRRRLEDLGCYRG